MARGDHIYVKLTVGAVPYQHHGIDLGDGTVVHLAPADGGPIAIRDSSDRFQVRKDSREDFCRGNPVYVVAHRSSRTGEEIAQTAEAAVGRTGYSLMRGNCEHFCTLCVSGKATSRQVEVGEATVSALISGVTKAAWSVSSKLGSRYAIRGATKAHPAVILADGVEVAVLAVTCRSNLSSRRSRAIARLSGTMAAAGVGAVFGGPAGAAICIASHASSTAISDGVSAALRKWMS